MILIVDSGATKADWIALSESGEKLFFTQTLGLSPEVLTEEIIVERITNNYELYKSRKEVTKLYFYGAGCGTQRMRTFLGEIFQPFFENAEIAIKEDTYAAVYATIGSGAKSVVCILGTGSNCCMWDGEKLIQKVESLGYILMDDCSGNYFGRQLLRDFYFNKFPEDLAQKFNATFELDADVIKNHLYKLPNPNTYLATFAKFLIENKDEPYCQELIAKGMQLFIDNFIKQFEEAPQIPVHFVGSIAFYLQEELKTMLQKNGLSAGIYCESQLMV